MPDARSQTELPFCEFDNLLIQIFAVPFQANLLNKFLVGNVVGFGSGLWPLMTPSCNHNFTKFESQQITTFRKKLDPTQ